MTRARSADRASPFSAALRAGAAGLAFLRVARSCGVWRGSAGRAVSVRVWYASSRVVLDSSLREHAGKRGCSTNSCAPALPAIT